MDCVAGNPATRLPCAGEHRGPVPGYSSAPLETAEHARNAWRRSPNTVLLDVRRHRRELIGKRMVTALEHQSWELKSKRSVCQNGVPQSKAPGGEEGGWPRTRVLVPRWLRQAFSRVTFGAHRVRAKLIELRVSHERRNLSRAISPGRAADSSGSVGISEQVRSR